ncbi:hypothetical protein ACFV9C_19920 [Kribbella sp. NPDC059898]|uniref:hypothetical protein n=1 Tax=Kribbella sp. NPDC059898 TaxID=3346995 RepID=UPI00364C2417
MAGWEGLRGELRRLIAEVSGALRAWPDPDSEPARVPVRIMLAAWAADIAAGLQATYPEIVERQVGLDAVSGGGVDQACAAAGAAGRAGRGEIGIDVEGLASLTVRSGWDLRQDVLVRNRGDREQVLITNGELASVVTDSSGRVVGEFAGPHPVSRVGFAVGAGESRPVPVLVGTASLVPELGYAVPPGQWPGIYTETGEEGQASLELAVAA